MTEKTRNTTFTLQNVIAKREDLPLLKRGDLPLAKCYGLMMILMSRN
jgi:hypothetical protein